MIICRAEGIRPSEITPFSVYLNRPCPLLAQSGHAGRGSECLPLGVKRTLSCQFGPLRCDSNPGGTIMAKRKKRSKVQKRAKLRRGNSAKRGSHKAVGKRTVAKAKPKRARVKKAARRIKRPVAPVIETDTAPSVVTTTEDEETPE
jgi:hypothetical protein